MVTKCPVVILGNLLCRRLQYYIVILLWAFCGVAVFLFFVLSFLLSSGLDHVRDDRVVREAEKEDEEVEVHLQVAAVVAVVATQEMTKVGKNYQHNFKHIRNLST